MCCESRPGDPESDVPGENLCRESRPGAPERGVPEGWILEFFQPVDGFLEGSTESDEEALKNLPRAVRKSLKQRVLPEEIAAMPLEAIPEDDVPEPMGDDNEEPDDDDDEWAEGAGDPLPEWAPSPQQARDLRLAHDNAGHPSNQDFARLLRRGNAKPEIARWARKSRVRSAKQTGSRKHADRAQCPTHFGSIMSSGSISWKSRISRMRRPSG